MMVGVDTVFLVLGLNCSEGAPTGGGAGGYTAGAGVGELLQVLVGSVRGENWYW